MTIDNAAPGAATSLTAYSAQARADVDGSGTRWVVAFRDGIYGYANVVHLDAGASTLTASPSGTLPAITSNPNWRPAVGYGPGRSYVSHWNTGHATGLRSIDPASGQIGNDTIVTASSGAAQTMSRVVAITGNAGGVPESDDGILLYRDTLFAGQFVVRRFRSHAGGGTVTNLGGSCGSGGASTTAVRSRSTGR